MIRKNKIIEFVFIPLMLLITISVFGQDKTIFKTDYNISYYPETPKDSYTKSRCKLDIRYPENIKDFTTVIWFHGGGLKTNNKFFPQPLINTNLCIVSVNYRLSPKVKSPSYIEDAAAAIAWVFNNIKKYGGDPNKIFISGHSAGGYLALMVGLDKHWLNQFSIDADNIAGIISLSGQTITHSTIREEKGIAWNKVIVDKYAPLNHVRKNTPPLILITGDRNIDIPGRYEENLYLKRLMEIAGNPNVELFEIQGFAHVEMRKYGIGLMVKKINRIEQKK